MQPARGFERARGACLDHGALALGVHRCLRERGEERASWIICLAVLGALTAMAVWQMRSAAAANALAAAMVPAAMVRAFDAQAGRAIFFGLGRAALAVVLIANPLSPMPTIVTCTIDSASQAWTV